MATAWIELACQEICHNTGHDHPQEVQYQTKFVNVNNKLKHTIKLGEAATKLEWVHRRLLTLKQVFGKKANENPLLATIGA